MLRCKSHEQVNFNFQSHKINYHFSVRKKLIKLGKGGKKRAFTFDTNKATTIKSYITLYSLKVDLCSSMESSMIFLVSLLSTKAQKHEYIQWPFEVMVTNECSVELQMSFHLKAVFSWSLGETVHDTAFIDKTCWTSIAIVLKVQMYAQEFHKSERTFIMSTTVHISNLEQWVWKVLYRCI